VGGGSETLTPITGSVSVTQPLYRGGRTVAATQQAEANVQAARAQLLSVEQGVLFAGATAYMDVLRDQAVLQLNRNNEHVLRRQLAATRDRFEVGEITKTDVAQAEARLSRAVTDRIRAEGTLAAARGVYLQVIGRPATDLRPPPRLDPLPRSEGEAVAAAIEENPDLRAAQFAEAASRHAVSVAVGELLPTVSLTGDLSRSEETVFADTTSESASLMAQLRVPLYQAGLLEARVREARQRNNEFRVRIEETSRTVREGVTQAWNRLVTAIDSLRAAQDQVRAAQIALEGVRREADVGLRTTLDVLDAQQEMLDGRVAVVVAERDRYVAAFELRAAMGRLTAQQLGLPVDLYDPLANYRRVRDAWWGIDVE